MTPTSRQIDHVVVAVRDLDEAAAAYERLGFTLTPRGRHPWGTANRLVQFAARNFIELLEVDRPQLVFEHDLAARPPRFSFGAFNRDFLAGGEGMSMLVLAGDDSAADVTRFRAAGIDTYAPFDFERPAELPDGSVGKVAFSLAFATHPAMPRAAFFTCHHRTPGAFWKPQFQSHANGGRAIAEAVLVAEEPRRYAGFLAGFAGHGARETADGVAAACGPHRLSIVSPAAAARRYAGHAVDLAAGPRLLAVAIEGDVAARRVTPAAEACGAVIEWRPATTARGGGHAATGE